MSSAKKSGSFKSMGLKEEILKSIDKMGFKHPTPIQRRAIPSILTGVDCVAMARTGSGKTAAFAIPTIQRLSKHNEIVGARAIVLSPTRELAMQTCKVFQLLSRYTDLRIALIVGGHSMEGQFDRLMNNPDIIIATPGRLIHHLEQDGGFSLSRVEMVILDEADRLFELGMSEQISQILKACPSGRQALLFSATLPSQLVSFAKAGLDNPEFIRLDSECSLSDKLAVYMAFTRPEAKPAALVSVLRRLTTTSKNSKTIVFVATKHHVDFLSSLIEKANVATVASIYGSLEQTVRTAALSQFKTGKASVLVVTDVAARGLDIPDVDNVVHYDFPCSPKLFIHRSGRTARAGKSGLCVALVTTSDLPYLMDLTMFIDARLVMSGSQSAVETPKVEDDMIVEVQEEAAKKRPIEIGSIPFVDEDAELVRRLVDNDPELESSKRSMDLSMGPYFKTRPSASKQAVRHAHSFLNSECGGPQSLLGKYLTILSVSTPSVSGEEDGREAILAQLRNFRPSQQPVSSMSTAVKSDTRKALEGHVLKAKKARELAAQMMQEQNEIDEFSESEFEEPVVPVKETPKKCFKSKAFFHTAGAGAELSEKEARIHELETHQMDLVPETHDELNARARFGKKWDSKKMKYVTVRIGSDGKAIKNESGKRMTKKNMEKGKLLYQEWAKKSKKRIQKVGEVEEDNGGYRKENKRQSTGDTKRGVKESFQAPKSVSSKQYHGEVPWNFLTNKQKRLETRKLKAGSVTSRGTEKHAATLKTPQSIAKARNLKDTRRVLQNPKKRKDFHKQSKDSYMKKQEAKIRAKAAPTRSWVKGAKPVGRR